MTKSIEDYPELKERIDKITYIDEVYEDGDESCCRSDVESIVVSMQATIDAQQERIKELEGFARVANRFAVGLAPILQSEGYHGLVENCQDLNQRALKLLNKEYK